MRAKTTLSLSCLLLFSLLYCSVNTLHIQHDALTEVKANSTTTTHVPLESNTTAAALNATQRLNNSVHPTTSTHPHPQTTVANTTSSTINNPAALNTSNASRPVLPHPQPQRPIGSLPILNQTKPFEIKPTALRNQINTNAATPFSVSTSSQNIAPHKPENVTVLANVGVTPENVNKVTNNTPGNYTRPIILAPNKTIEPPKPNATQPHWTLQPLNSNTKPNNAAVNTTVVTTTLTVTPINQARKPTNNTHPVPIEPIKPNPTQPLKPNALQPLNVTTITAELTVTPINTPAKTPQIKPFNIPTKPVQNKPLNSPGKPAQINLPAVFFKQNIPGVFAPPPAVTKQIPNPLANLSITGRQCADKCRDLGGISCKRWNDDSITCCSFLGCQWGFSCNKDKIITVPGCKNKE